MEGRYFYRPANIMVDEAIAWWRATQGGPRFLMLHLMDPHDPYNPPAEDVSAVGSPHLDPDENAYDAEIRFMDRALGRFLDTLDDQTWIILTADHGETFEEHPDPYPKDYWPKTRHGHTLYQELLHVPLMVTGPDVIVDTVNRPVRSFDVVPTILALAEAEPFIVSGQPLWEALGRTAPAKPQAVGAQAVRFGTEKRAARLGAHKLIRTLWGDELYDLVKDPGETHNRAKADSNTVARLAPWLPPMNSNQGTTAPQLDEETQRQLEALGYVQ
jgi:arylsulfatase